MIIKEALKDALSLLGESSTALIDVEVLLSFTLDVSKEYLISHPDKEVEEADMTLFKFYLERLKSGEPLAYIINSKEFFSLDFYVDKRVLIPRPETEFLVERSLNFLRNYEDVKGRFKVLEVGTGSGNISVSIAKSLLNEGVDAVEEILALDVSEDALDVAKMNAEQHSVDYLIRFVQSDLLEAIDDGEEFDLIVANLPYIGESVHRHIDENVEKFEPSLALFAGENGLDLYEKLFLDLITKNINFNLILIEFGFGQAEDFAIVVDKYFPGNWSIKQDLAGIDRFLIVTNN
jgi:release factor glutamine methyltransferase